MIDIATLFAALCIASISDIRTRKIPDHVHILLLVSGILSVTLYGSDWVSRAAGFLAVGVMMLIIGLASENLGGGDIKMGACLAFALDLLPACYSLLTGFGLAAIFLLIRKGCKKPDMPIPLAPFLTVGCIAALFFSN